MDVAAGSSEQILTYLYQHRYSHLISYLRRLSGGKSSIQGVDFEDIVSQAFTKCLHKPFSTPGQAYNYLKAACYTLYVDEARRGKIALFIHNLPDRPTHDQMDQVHNQDLLDRILAPLVDRDKKLLLDWAQGASIRELAQPLGLTNAGVKAIMVRAKAKARAKLQRDCNRTACVGGLS